MDKATNRTPDDPSSTEFSGRRVVIAAAGLIVIGIVYELAVRGSLAGALSLTGAGAVAIINFRWLEVLLRAVIQPEKPRFDRGSGLRLLGRMGLLAGTMAALLWVPRIDPVAVALGFSALVAGLLIEGLRWARIGGG
jgi:hypothetical protein